MALHLDHANSLELAQQAVQAGYTSIMIDGSRLSYEENVRLTRQAVETAAPRGIPTEAELGEVGGKEDDLEGKAGYTDPAQAARFVRKTGISSLAVAIGTAHGFYQGIPVLDIQRLSRIREQVSIPLVLHGASGLPDEDVRECIRRGICKVNFATELRVAYSSGVRRVLKDDPDVFDPKKYGAAGREQVKQLVMERMHICGCPGQA